MTGDAGGESGGKSITTSEFFRVGPLSTLIRLPDLYRPFGRMPPTTSNWSEPMQVPTTILAGSPSPAVPAPSDTADDAALRDAARRLESAFLAEMLKTAGLGRVPQAFGGGAGETQFASYLRHAQARAMADAGGIGLAEQLFHALQAEARHDRG
ncbi:MAG: rod-binding protein [Rhodosalinus sp.]